MLKIPVSIWKGSGAWENPVGSDSSLLMDLGSSPALLDVSPNPCSSKEHILENQPAQPVWGLLVWGEVRIFGDSFLLELLREQDGLGHAQEQLFQG